MKKNYWYLIATVTMITLVPQMTLAVDKGNPRKGKYLYRKNCLSCHQYGTKHQLGPDSKTMEEWTKLFSKENRTKIHCLNEWKLLSDKDISDIFTHLHNHASDSPAPAACR